MGLLVRDAVHGHATIDTVNARNSQICARQDQILLLVQYLIRDNKDPALLKLDKQVSNDPCIK